MTNHLFNVIIRRLSDERLYDRDSRTGSINNYDRIVDSRDTPYIKRSIGYLDDSDYPNRSRSRDRPFSRNVNNNSYGDQLDNRYVLSCVVSISKFVVKLGICPNIRCFCHPVVLHFFGNFFALKIGFSYLFVWFESVLRTDVFLGENSGLLV